MLVRDYVNTDLIIVASKEGREERREEGRKKAWEEGREEGWMEGEKEQRVRGRKEGKGMYVCSCG